MSIIDRIKGNKDKAVPAVREPQAFKRDTVFTDSSLLSHHQDNIREDDHLRQKELQTEESVRAIFRETFLRNVVPDLDNTTITDISFNGEVLRVQDNSRGRLIVEYQPSREEVRGVLKRIANIQGHEFVDTEPILDTEVGGVRLSAMHSVASPSGDTFSIRISRPSLAIRDLGEMIQEPAARLLEALVRANQNIILSGVTGTGKTEVQKYLVGLINDIYKIIVMEDTMDSHLKELYPHKDILSWRTLTQDNRVKKIGYGELSKATLRNNPEWAIIAETRGEDAYYMLQIALTGHAIMTTIHAEEAAAIPLRILDMISENRTINTELTGKNIAKYLSIGVQLKAEISATGVRRYISEIAEFVDYKNGDVVTNMLYKVTKEYDSKVQAYKMSYKVGKVSERMVERLTSAEVIHLLPDIFHPHKVKEGK